MAKLRAHFVLSTHWDREWYQSFQNFRYQLVQLLDRVMDGLDDGTLQGPFQTDGQAIILEDYLEIRPQAAARIRSLASQDRLIIGPWYVLPDEFLVSGESLIRNIRLGRQIARDFGGTPSQAGFVCDLFGHNSQMPQIFAGFGIHGGFVWRGLNHLTSRHVRWQGADGTELIAYRFPGGGYCDYCFRVRGATDRERPFEAARFTSDLETYLHDEAEHTEIDAILLFDGGDHEEWDQISYQALMSQRGSFSDFDIQHTSLDAYLADLIPQAGQIDAVVHGELRDPGIDYHDQQWVIPGVLSSRAWIKQSNAACETLLCSWAEPTSAFTSLLLGREYPQGYLDVAWKWLLKNHPHDSICGCSIDEVHEDMKFRFSQTRQIGDRLTKEAIGQLGIAAAGSVAEDEVKVSVHNPLPHPLDETVEMTLQIPQHWPTFNEFFGFEPKPGFRIFGADGQEIPYQRLNQTMSRIKTRIYETKFPQAYRTDDVHVSLPIELPPLGYTTLSIRPDERGQATRHPSVPGMIVSERSMSNGILTAVVESNGTLTVTDLRSGQLFTRLLTFEDSADIGDGWYHGQAVNDQRFTSTASTSAVAVVHDGPFCATLRIRTTMAVPKAFHFDERMARTEQLADLVLDSQITMRPGADRLEVETRVENGADDHRLRVLFPSGVDSDTYLADTPFDAVERKIALRSDNHLYRELEVETRPQQNWTAIYSAGRGLAIISPGQYESAVQDIPERTLALTLLRATRRTVFTDGEPAGQLPGTHSFRYWIVPLATEPNPTHLFDRAQQMAAGLRYVHLSAADVKPSDRPLPATLSCMSLTGPAVLTSMRQVDGAVELRVFNPTDSQAESTFWLNPLLGLASMTAVDMESQPTGTDQLLTADGATIALGPKEIATLRLTK